jgi:hypothetical protein
VQSGFDLHDRVFEGCLRQNALCEAEGAGAVGGVQKRKQLKIAAGYNRKRISRGNERFGKSKCSKKTNEFGRERV